MLNKARENYQPGIFWTRINREGKVSHMAEDTKTYTCPMHPDIQRDHSGMCPECGMNLVPSKKKTALPDEHMQHDKHEGHSPNMFKQKFWISLLLTIPTLLFSDTVQGWLGFHLGFPGSQYIPAGFGVIIFWCGGLVFLKGAKVVLEGR